MPLDPAEAYTRAAAVFGEVVAALADDEWDRPVRDGWTVAATVAWVVVGDSTIPGAVEGEPLPSHGEIDAAILGPQPVAAWRGTALAAIRALQEDGAVTRRVAHPEGSLVVGDLVGQRVTDNLVRSWDIGEAVGRPTRIPDDLADWCLDFWAGHADAVLRGGVLPEAPVEPPADADAPTRLLALTGRRA